MEYTLKTITIHITPNSVSIQQNVIHKQDSHLYIIVEPDITSSKIEKIRVKWNQEHIDIVLSGEFLTGITYCLKGSHSDMYNQLQTYMGMLQESEKAVIVAFYKKHISDGFVFDGFLAGLACYLTLVWFIDNNIKLPFSFPLPCSVVNRDILTRNVFTHMHIPLMMYSKTTTGVLAQLIVFVQNFINMWEAAFIPGPSIQAADHYQAGLSILLGYTQDLLDKINKRDASYTDLLHRIQKIEARMGCKVAPDPISEDISDSEYSSESESEVSPPRRIWTRRR